MSHRPEDEVASLSLSRQMKGAGFPQEGIWNWVPKVNNSFEPKHILWHLSEDTEPFPDVWKLDKMVDVILAPTTTQMGMWLPEHVTTWKDMTKIEGQNSHIGYVCAYAKSELTPLTNTQYAVTEPDARAKILLHLAKEGLLDPRGVK